MANPNYPTLQTAQINFAPIQFAAYTPQQYNPSLAFNRLDKMIEAQEAAAKNQANYNQMLGKFKSNLNQNDVEWFEKNIQDKANEEIQKIADSGFYGDLNNKITTLAGELANNNGLIGRLQANMDYLKLVERQRARLQRGEVDQLAFDRWLAENPYKYNPAYSGDKEMIGKLADLETLQDTLNVENLFVNAAKMVEYEASQSERAEPDTSLKDNTVAQPTVNDMNLAGGVKSATTTPKVIGYTKTSQGYTRKQKERILENVSQMLRNPTINLQLQQRFKDVYWKYKQMEKEYNSLSYSDPKKQQLANELKQYRNSTLKYENTYLTENDFETWVEMNVNKNIYAKNLAFNRTQNGYAYSESYDDMGGRARGNGNGINGENWVPDNEIVIGSSVSKSTTPGYDVAGQAGTEAGQILENITSSYNS